MARGQGLAHKLWTGEVSYDFIRTRNRWYLLSGVLLIVSILAVTIGGLNLGIEFRGGSDFQVKVATVDDSTVPAFRQAVESAGIGDLEGATVTTVGNDTVRVQTRTLDDIAQRTAIRQAIADEAGVPEDEVAYQHIGASWGQQITRQAAIALVVFLVAVSLLIWAYFRDWKMSMAALVALAHDLIITVGVYALLGFTVTPATMIGVLTILGYSLYDTVVVFDKVRENVAEMAEDRRTYSEAANHAVNQVLVRSINTTIVGVLPVAALLIAGVFVLGSGPLEDLGLALFVGMIAGAYSSLFIATPLLAQFKEREPAVAEHRAKVDRHRAKAALKGAGESVEDDIEPAVPRDEKVPASPVVVQTESVVRVQPVRSARSKRKGS